MATTTETPGRTFALTGVEIDHIIGLVAASRAAADGDSNDAEIGALSEALETLVGALGLDDPVPAPVPAPTTPVVVVTRSPDATPNVHVVGFDTAPTIIQIDTSNADFDGRHGDVAAAELVESVIGQFVATGHPPGGEVAVGLRTALGDVVDCRPDLERRVVAALTGTKG